jgi:hypothetical protein
MHRMLTIEIVSDVVCPWCFIGTRRLETAIALVRDQIPDFTYQTRWLPFFLNPDTPPEGEPYLPFLERKFGSRAAVEALFGRIREAGRAYGIDYAFEKIELRANTLRAHRLIHWAQQRRCAGRAPVRRPVPARGACRRHRLARQDCRRVRLRCGGGDALSVVHGRRSACPRAGTRDSGKGDQGGSDLHSARKPGHCRRRGPGGSRRGNSGVLTVARKGQSAIPARYRCQP